MLLSCSCEIESRFGGKSLVSCVELGSVYGAESTA